jgi:hypothetical protein
MWLLQLFLFLGVVYLMYRPQHLLTLFFYGCKMCYYAYQAVTGVCRLFNTCYQKCRRYYLLKTKKFEERVVMQPPNLSTLTKKMF